MRDGLSVRLTPDAIEPAEAFRWVTDPGAGGTVLFSGTVRDHSSAGDVTGLEYEAWDQQAERKLTGIGEELFGRWHLCKAAVWHRIGALDVGEVSVIVCCSAPHRGDAFEAARHGIERIKQDVPIWKKERLVEGEPHWVMGS